jgi:hypothetical protein
MALAGGPVELGDKSDPRVVLARLPPAPFTSEEII